MDWFALGILNKILSGTITEDDRKTIAFEMEDNVVEEIEGSNHRWEQEMSVVIQIGDQFFSMGWMRGLTECQDNSFYDDPVEVERITEVKTVTVVTYKPIEQ